jgi:hypothetical protein
MLEILLYIEKNYQVVRERSDSGSKSSTSNKEEGRMDSSGTVYTEQLLRAVSFRFVAGA